MNLLTWKRIFSPILRPFVTVNWYSTTQDNGKNNFRERRPRFRPNVGVRHRLNAMITDYDEDYDEGVQNSNHVELKMKKLNLQLEDLDDEETNYDETLLKANRVYDDHKQEEEWRRLSTIRNIMRRKYFKDSPEPCFLTVAAKEQLRYLHESDPETWTYAKLAESFPISVSGVKKLLKHKSVPAPYSEAATIKHDKRILENWKLLKTGQGGPIASTIQRRLLTGRLNFEAMNGHTKLPMPTEEWKNKQLPATSNVSPVVVVGEFESIIKEYRSLAYSKAAKKDSQTLLAVQSQKLAEDKRQDEHNQTAELSHNLSREKGQLYSTFEEFKESLKNQLDKSNNLNDSERYQDWMKKLKPSNNATGTLNEVYVEKPDVFDMFEGKMETYTSSDGPELTWDSPRGAKSDDEKEAYIYDSVKGYQRPYGRHEIQEQIKIESNRRKANSIYQKDDCFYDGNGEFLYRVPHLPLNKD